MILDFVYIYKGAQEAVCSTANLASIITDRNHMLGVVVQIIIIVHVYVKIAVFAVRKMFNYKEIHQN